MTLLSRLVCTELSCTATFHDDDDELYSEVLQASSVLHCVINLFVLFWHCCDCFLLFGGCVCVVTWMVLGSAGF